MTADGLLERVPYRDQGARTRHEYLPTDKALALYPVLAALMEWGERHVPGVVPVRLHDRRSGEPLVAALVAAGTPSCPPALVEVRPVQCWPKSNSRNLFDYHSGPLRNAIHEKTGT